MSDLTRMIFALEKIREAVEAQARLEPEGDGTNEHLTINVVGIPSGQYVADYLDSNEASTLRLLREIPGAGDAVQALLNLTLWGNQPPALADHVEPMARFARIPYGMVALGTLVNTLLPTAEEKLAQRQARAAMPLAIAAPTAPPIEVDDSSNVSILRPWSRPRGDDPPAA